MVSKSNTVPAFIDFPVKHENYVYHFIYVHFNIISIPYYWKKQLFLISNILLKWLISIILKYIVSLPISKVELIFMLFYKKSIVSWLC